MPYSAHAFEPSAPADGEPVGPGRAGSLYDPTWLRRSFRRCLWDGRARRRKAGEFCSSRCEQLYAFWEDRQRLYDQLSETVELPDRPGGVF